MAVCDAARDTLKNVDSGVCIEGTHTLRTNNSHLWVLPAPEVQKDFGDFGRLLTIKEKCRVSGVLPSSLSDLDDEQIELSLGNTIPIPLIGTVLLPVLRAWAEIRS